MTRNPSTAPASGKRYQQVAQALIEDIRSGRRCVGDSLGLTVVRRYTDRDGALVPASVPEHPGDRFTYTMSLERGWQAGGGSAGACLHGQLSPPASPCFG